MNRFHIHIAVDNVEDNVQYYTKLFGTDPVTVKTDYAKWALEDPRINFAISTQGQTTGVNHLGIQVESEDELQLWRSRAEAASQNDIIHQEHIDCCYANGNKYWTVDPQGIPWEHFHTLAESKVFASDTNNTLGVCCTPGGSATNTACCN